LSWRAFQKSFWRSVKVKACERFWSPCAARMEAAAAVGLDIRGLKFSQYEHKTAATAGGPAIKPAACRETRFFHPVKLSGRFSRRRKLAVCYSPDTIAAATSPGNPASPLLDGPCLQVWSSPVVNRALYFSLPPALNSLIHL
jgi:hypothetical protein